MKFTIQMKDPDGPHECLSSAVEESMFDIKDEDEREAIREVRFEKLKQAASKWLKYDEYLTIEIDTEAGTAKVLEAK